MIERHTGARSQEDRRVVALAGRPPPDRPLPPVWTVNGLVLAIRPDGQVVWFRLGETVASPDALASRYQPTRLPNKALGSTGA